MPHSLGRHRPSCLPTRKEGPKEGWFDVGMRGFGRGWCKGQTGPGARACEEASSRTWAELSRRGDTERTRKQKEGLPGTREGSTQGFGADECAPRAEGRTGPNPLRDAAHTCGAVGRTNAARSDARKGVDARARERTGRWEAPWKPNPIVTGPNRRRFHRATSQVSSRRSC